MQGYGFQHLIRFDGFDSGKRRLKPMLIHRYRTTDANSWQTAHHCHHQQQHGNPNQNTVLPKDFRPGEL